MRKHPKHLRISSGSLFDPVTILSAQLIEISIMQASLTNKSPQSPYYSGSQSLKNLTVFHEALAFSLPHGSNWCIWELAVTQQATEILQKHLEILKYWGDLVFGHIIIDFMCTWPTLKLSVWAFFFLPLKKKKKHLRLLLLLSRYNH